MSSVVETTRAPRPLEGIRVFELSIAIAGPVCGRYLAHFGAEVIKVESLKNPDVIRLLGSTWLARDRHGLQAWGDCGPYVNERMTGKRSITLDLQRPEGWTIFRRLTAGVDVVCETSPPGSQPQSEDRLGLDHALWSQRSSPRLERLECGRMGGLRRTARNRRPRPSAAHPRGLPSPRLPPRLAQRGFRRARRAARPPPERRRTARRRLGSRVGGCRGL
jgi:hypothetical protein